ncbi:MAG: hypothetical protein GXO07_04445 [Crenarchaeota archaeon]|nr:hypothetical protein [Thermoproteota archaeon]
MKRLAFVLLATMMVPLFAMSNGAPNFSCTMCHQDAKPIAPQNIVISGLPQYYEPGKAYKLTIEIKDVNECTPAMVACGGFALQASAGEFKIIDPENTFIAQPAPGESFVTHTKAGSMMKKWTVEWIAPQEPQPVTLKVAALAANGDGTPFGDYFGMKVFQVQPAQTGMQEQPAQQAEQPAGEGNVVTITKTVWVTMTVTKTVTVTLTG